MAGKVKTALTAREDARVALGHLDRAAKRAYSAVDIMCDCPAYRCRAGAAQRLEQLIADARHLAQAIVKSGL